MNVAVLRRVIFSVILGRDVDVGGKEPSLPSVLSSVSFWGAAMLIIWLVARWRFGLL